MNKPLSFINVDSITAKIICTCGWESSPFRKSPFDPLESLMGMQTEHLKCNDKPPEVYYAAAQVIHGKLCILGEPLSEPGSREKMEEAARGLAPDGGEIHVVEVKIVSTWKGLNSGSQRSVG